MNDMREKIITFIRNYIKSKGISPTVREISLGVDTCLSNTHRYLDEMKDNGLVDWQPGLSRTIRLKERGKE